MDSRTLPTRSQVPEAETWDAASIVASPADWPVRAAAVRPSFAELAAQAGRLTDSGPELLAWLEQADAARVEVGKLVAYASMCHDGDTADPEHAARWQQALALDAELSASLAFAVPELLAAGQARLDGLMAETPELAGYAHQFDTLLRRAAHVREPGVEEVLARAAEPLDSFYGARGSLVDADLRFGTAESASGESLAVAEGTVHGLMEHPDRDLRRQAWERYCDGYLSVRNTVAALLAGHVRGTEFIARARRYSTVRAMALDSQKLPDAVLENVIASFRDHRGLWQRYFDVRRRALGLDQLAPYDLWAPLIADSPRVDYLEACRWIVDGMAPLGDEYVVPLARGLASERWVDVGPNQGKRGGAYSGGSYGTRPFILLNWAGSLTDMSVLAHELGHSMHSYFSRECQPPRYANYGTFVAEVASNFNQALVRAHLLATRPEPAFQIALLCEAMANFYRYFFVMPLLAQFEDDTYQQAARGAGLTADGFSSVMGQLLSEAYGDVVSADAARMGMLWAQFPHLYMNYYVFQYATGIAAAHALAEGVLQQQPGAAARYLDFLKTGGSRYPLDALAVAGVDMTARAPLDMAYAVMTGYVDRLERLLAAP